MRDIPDDVRTILSVMLSSDEDLSTEQISAMSGLSVPSTTKALFWAGGQGLITPLKDG